MHFLPSSITDGAIQSNVLQRRLLLYHFSYDDMPPSSGDVIHMLDIP